MRNRGDGSKGVFFFRKRIKKQVVRGMEKNCPFFTQLLLVRRRTCLIHFFFSFPVAHSLCMATISSHTSHVHLGSPPPWNVIPIKKIMPLISKEFTCIFMTHPKMRPSLLPHEINVCFVFVWINIILFYCFKLVCNLLHFVP